MATTFAPEILSSAGQEPEPQSPKSRSFNLFLADMKGRFGRFLDLVGSQGAVGTEDPNASVKSQLWGHEPNGTSMSGVTPKDFRKLAEPEQKAA